MALTGRCVTSRTARCAPMASPSPTPRVPSTSPKATEGTSNRSLMLLLLSLWSAASVFDVTITMACCLRLRSSRCNTILVRRHYRGLTCPFCDLLCRVPGVNAAVGVDPTCKNRAAKPVGAGDFCRMLGIGGAYARITAYNSTTLTYEHVANNGGQVTDSWTVTQPNHGAFPEMF